MTRQHQGVLARDDEHGIELILSGNRAALQMKRPPWLRHEIPSNSIAEFISIIHERSDVELKFHARPGIAGCVATIPFIAIFRGLGRPAFAYVPVDIAETDSDAIFKTFPDLPLLVTGSLIIANPALYAWFMCKEGRS